MGEFFEVLVEKKKNNSYSKTGVGLYCYVSFIYNRAWNKLTSFIEIYNGEFDPGSGWTLAAGLIHASRTVVVIQ